MPPDDTEGLEEADLPGFDDDSPSPEPDVPTEQSGTNTPSSDGVSDAAQEARDLAETSASPEAAFPEGHPTSIDEMPSSWTDAELDRWFENDFGGDARFREIFSHDDRKWEKESKEVLTGLTNDVGIDLDHGVRSYLLKIFFEPDSFGGPTSQLYEHDPWGELSRETKAQFRRGWEGYEEYHASSLPAHQTHSDVEDLQSVVLGGDDLSGNLSDGYPEGDAGDLQSVVLGDVGYEQRHRKEEPSPGPIRWIWVGGGVGVLGLVLTVGFFLSSGSDNADEETVALPSVAPVVEVTTPPSTEVIVEDTEAPTVAIGAPEPSVVAVVADPADYVTVTETAVLVDPNGDTWIEVTLVAPWLPGPPAADTAFSLIVGVGIDLGYQTNTSWWTLYAGSTRGEGSIVGDTVTVGFDGEMWVTPDGKLTVKLPGSSPTGGLPAADLGPDAAIYSYGQVGLEEGSEIQTWEETTPLGEVTQVTDPLPHPDSRPVDVDFLGPIRLDIPDTSGS